MAHNAQSTFSSTAVHRDETSKGPRQACPVLSSELAHLYSCNDLNVLEEYITCQDQSTSATSRFVRLNPRFDRYETLSLLHSELPPQSPPPRPVLWLDHRLGFYSISGEFALAQSKCFQSGRVYGMDVSSGAAVAALLLEVYDVTVTKDIHDVDHRRKQAGLTAVQEGNTVVGAEIDVEFRVLDLCCAPGLKTCAIVDLLEDGQVTLNSHSAITVVGVDISKSRMALCKKIITKYQVNEKTSGRVNLEDAIGRNAGCPSVSVRLYCTDGTTFGIESLSNLVFDSNVAKEEKLTTGNRKRMNKSAKAREQKRLSQLSVQDLEIYHSPIAIDVGCGAENAKEREVKVQEKAHVVAKLFNCVLVDAECSTDGSVRHMQQRYRKSQNASERDTNKVTTTNETLTNAAKLDKLVNLQKRLILSGFRLLKPGGTMIYSTCSLAREQNEEVVSWLLNSFSEVVELVPVSFLSTMTLNTKAGDTADAFVLEGFIPGTVRFFPNVKLNTNVAKDQNFWETDVFGDGFFLAKLRKRAVGDTGLF